MACLMIGTSILVSCNDEMANVISPEEEIQNQIKPEYVTLSFNVSADEAASRTSYEESETTIIAKWSEDDYIYVGAPAAELTEAVSIDAYNSGFTKLENPTISDDGKTATFSGTVEVTTGSKIMAFYCKEPKMLEVTTSGVKMNFELAQSVSEINDLSQYDLMSATADYTNETESINLNFVHECAILKVNATGIEVEAGANVSKLEFTLPDGAGFYNAVTIGTDGNRTYGEIENTFSVQLNGAVATDGKLGAYCMVVTDGISAATNLGIKAIVNKTSGDYTYTNTMGVSSNIQKGKFYYTKERAMTLDKSIKELNGYKVIDNVDKFKTIASDASSNYILTRNLDFTGIDFTPIPTFSGTFEGAENTLSNITLNITDGNGGIFAVNEGTIQNLTVKGATVTKESVFGSNSNGLGVIVGTNAKSIKGCTVINSAIKVKITDEGNIGLIAGFNKGTGSVTECTVEGSSSVKTMEGTNYKSCIGGLIGKSLGSVKYSFVKSCDISYDYLATDATGANIGGLIGQLNTSIKGCYAKTTIYANTKGCTIGGLLGAYFITTSTPPTLEGCYAIGNITLSTNSDGNSLAGLIGNNTGTGSRNINYCYTSVDTQGKGSSIYNKNNNSGCTPTECYYMIDAFYNTIGEKATTTELQAKLSTFNSVDLENYEFVAGTGDEPLIIQKKQQ